MARRDEEFARKAFDLHVAPRSSPVLVRWFDGANPPDFELHVGQERFAVEVTRICEQANIGARRVPANRIHAGLETFVEDLRTAVIALGEIPGAYVLALDGGGIPRPAIDAARARALAYISRTAELESAHEEVLLQVREIEWTITKHHSDRRFIEAIVCSSPEGVWWGEITAEFPRLIAKAVTDKSRKLRNIDLPKVLLLVDEYHHAEAGMWHAALPRDTMAVFHTVARVHGEHECEVLFSSSSAWAVEV